MPGGVEDGVRGALRLACTHAHEIGISLPGGVEHPLAVVHPDVILAEQLSQPPQRGRGQRAGLEQDAIERDRRAWAGRHPDGLGKEGERVGRQRPGRVRVAPAPPPHPRRPRPLSH